METDIIPGNMVASIIHFHPVSCHYHHDHVYKLHTKDSFCYSILEINLIYIYQSTNVEKCSWLRVGDMTLSTTVGIHSVKYIEYNQPLVLNYCIYIYIKMYCQGEHLYVFPTLSSPDMPFLNCITSISVCCYGNG